MIAAWVLFGAASGAALSAAAAAADSLAAAWRRPRRFIWAVALAATAAWPALAALGPRSLATRSVSGVPGAGSAFRLPRVAVPVVGGVSARALDTTLLVLWGAASTALLIRLAVAGTAVRGWRRAWPMRDVDGVCVRVAPDVGPAVVGLRPMELVLPEWALAFDGAERALILRHEAEHQAARDPVLLLVAAVLTALVPWHPALWWQARRLRLAVELDCDARVLRFGPPPIAYARLLLEVAQRRATRAPRLAAPLVTSAATHLERRIAAMRAPRGPAPRARMLAFGAVAVAAVGVACTVEAPTGAPVEVYAATRTAAGLIRASQAGGPTSTRGYVEFRIDAPAALLNRPRIRYPDALDASSIAGTVLARVVVDTAGRADPRTLRVLSTHPAVAAAVAGTLPAWRFRAARVGRHPVKQLVEVPVQFALRQ